MKTHKLENYGTLKVVSKDSLGSEWTHTDSIGGYPYNYGIYSNGSEFVATIED